MAKKKTKKRKKSDIEILIADDKNFVLRDEDYKRLIKRNKRGTLRAEDLDMDE